MSSRLLNDLSPDFRPKAMELLARFVEARINVRIIETLRTMEEHQANLAKGVSWISRSKHCDGIAIDIAPVEVLDKKNWDPASPLWLQMGKIAESISGVAWGGRWENHPDQCHFEMLL